MKKSNCVLALVTVLLLSQAVQGRAAETNDRFRVAVDLADGSRLMGTPRLDAITLRTGYGAVDVPLARIARVTVAKDHESVSCELANGDRMSGNLAMGSLELETCLGKISLGVKHITGMTVYRGNASVIPPEFKDAMILYYPFDKDSGSKVEDNAGKNEGVVEGAQWTPRGKNGGAYEFDGKNSCITVGNTEAFDSMRAMTFTAWIRLKKFPQDFSGIVSRRTPSDLWWFGAKNGRGLQLYISGFGNGGDRTTGAGTVELGSWCHVAFSYEAGKCSAVYINGKTLNSVPISGSMRREESTPLRIGRGYGTPETFDGTIDEVMIFNRALSEEEVGKLYGLQK